MDFFLKKREIQKKKRKREKENEEKKKGKGAQILNKLRSSHEIPSL